MAFAGMLSRLNPFARSQPSGRQLQLGLDTATIYASIVSSCASLHPSPPPPDPSQSEIARLVNVSSLPPLEYQAVIVRRHLQSQTGTLLHATSQAILAKSPEEELIKSLNYAPHVQPSTIVEAGNGLFIRGSARPGDIIALYPGVSYLPSQLRREQLTPGDYAISRYDGVIIDAAQPIALNIASIIPPDTEVDLDQLVHPFANAHLINHPPPSGVPNTLQFMLDLDLESFPSPMCDLVPVGNSPQPVSAMDRIENLAIRQATPGLDHHVLSASQDRVRRTIAVVALKHIENEEIFFNYRFNPNLKTPSWYHDCDPEMSARRWSARNALLS